MEASALSAPAGLHRASVTSRLLPLRSDEQLVALFRSGNEDAFRVIHDRYRQRLFAYARQMLGGSRADAEDVLQDVFLRAYRALRADERPVALRAWLYRVAHNRCVDHLRRPTPAPADVFEVSRTPLLDPLVEAERRDELQRLVSDVRRLPEQQRSALLMREMDGMSYAELADALETTVPAVKSLLVRARIGLVEAIEARDTDCADIRHDLAASFDRGVRASGLARRHLKDCGPCTLYRTQLREVRRGFAALSPAPAPVGIFAKLLGLGSAGSGAAAGGAAAGSSTAVVGGGAAAVTATKVAAVVCCAAALTGGAAVEVKQFTAPSDPAPAARRHAPAAAQAPVVPAARNVAAPRDSGPPLLPPMVGTTPRGSRTFDVDGLTAPATPVGPPAATTGPRDSTGGQVAPDEAPAASTTADESSPSESPTAAVTTLLGTGPATAPQNGSGSDQTGSESSGASSASASSTSSSGSGGAGTSSASSSSTSGSGSSSSAG